MSSKQKQKRIPSYSKHPYKTTERVADYEDKRCKLLPTSTYAYSNARCLISTFCLTEWLQSNIYVSWRMFIRKKRHSTTDMKCVCLKNGSTQGPITVKVSSLIH